MQIVSIKETANETANETAVCDFCKHPDVFRNGLCAICFEDHYV